MSEPEVPAEDGRPVSEQAEVQPRAVVAPAMPETPCAGCGRTRTEAEGGRIFTHCDTCWPTAPAPPDALKSLEEIIPVRDFMILKIMRMGDASIKVYLDYDITKPLAEGSGPALSVAILAALEVTK